MVQLIVGEKGKGKTKHLLDKVNSEIKTVSGNIVYLDKSTKHMYELNNKVRLIDVSDYFIENFSEFLGFVCGIISQDHDLEQMYFDSFFPISKANVGDLDACIETLANCWWNVATASPRKECSTCPEDLPTSVRPPNRVSSERFWRRQDWS